MSPVRVTFLLSVCLLIEGCTTASLPRDSKQVTPVTYKAMEDIKIERTVGKLRRLMVLPVQLMVSPEDPKMCLEKCGWEGLSVNIEAEAVTCLREKRGYEVSSGGELLRDNGPVFTLEELSNYARDLASSAREGDPDKPQPETVRRVRELGKWAGVDGIVVIQGSATSLTLWDLAAGYASFSLSLPLSFLRVGISLRADVYETSTGRAVWTSTLSSGWEPNSQEHYGIVLFERIEPAIPRVFTRPPEIDAHLEPPSH